MIPTLFVISALVYFIIDLPPGDCVTSQIDELLSRGDPDAMRRADELRQLYGLDQPLWQRYLHWVGGHLPLGFRPQLPGHRAGVRPDRRAAGAHHRDGDRPPSPSSGSCRSSSASTPPPTSTSWATTSPRSSASSASSIPNFLLALVLLYVGKVYFGLSIGGLMDPEYIEQPMSWGKAWSVAAAPGHPGDRHRHVGHRRHDPPPARQPARRAAEAVRRHRPRQGPAAAQAPDQVSAAPRHQPVRRRHRRSAARGDLGLGHRLGRAVAADHRADAAGRAEDPGRQPRRHLPAVRGDADGDRHAGLGPALAALDPRIRFGATSEK